MANNEALAKLDRLRDMAKKRAGTSGFSRLDLAALQMAVDVLELIVDADRSHGGDMETHDIDSKSSPKVLCVGMTDEYYGETAFECFVEGGESLRKFRASSA